MQETKEKLMKKSAIYLILTLLTPFTVSAGTFSMFDPSEKELFEAVKKNNYEKVEKLLKEGVSPNIRDDREFTPLHYADDYKIAEILIKNGAKVNVKNKYGHPPLMYAIGRSQVKIVKLLVKQGADIHFELPNEDSIILLDSIRSIWNYRTKHYKYDKILIEKHIRIMNYLLAKGVDINEKNKQGNTILFAAVNFLSPKTVIEFLIQKGAKVNVINNYGESPLDWAIKKKRKKIIELLKKHGAKSGSELKNQTN
jgi:ankyrin repeat protein